MKKPLYKIELTQMEGFDPVHTRRVEHCIIYDAGTGVAIDITAEVGQRPVSSGRPYEVLPKESVGVLEKYLSGESKPVTDLSQARAKIPTITSFTAQELAGEEYDPLRESMTEVRDAQGSLDDKMNHLRGRCLEAKIVKPQPER